MMIDTELADTAQRELLDIARQSLCAAVNGENTRAFSAAQLLPALLGPACVFVTLSSGGRLRGCVGNLEPEPLAESVAWAARQAALFDPRFPAVYPGELTDIHLEISVLSPHQPLPVTSRKELMAALRPGRDGLLLTEGASRATFLPKVWEQLPEPALFVDQLLLKAGLPVDYWSPNLRWSRYGAQTFGMGSGL
ncbi:MAG: AmmeMemoRadiSam system protein A [Halioglobus sp.]|nr:AmmeMemoRadiSam system protein A [Halioglobus sp.]